MDDYAAENVLPFRKMDSWYEASAHEASERSQFLTRLLVANGDAATDCETLEVILSAATSPLNAHLLAPQLLERFGSLGKVIHTDARLLSELDGVDENIIRTLMVMRQTTRRIVKSQIVNKPVILSWSALMHYCKIASGYGDVEQFRVLFLNHRHMLIADEVMQEGTVNHTPVYPREIAKRALELSAAAIILIHNHPSGDPTPSLADIDITKKIVKAAATVNVAVHDHVIVAESGHYSFKSFGLMPDEEPVTATAATATATTQHVQVQLSLF